MMDRVTIGQYLQGDSFVHRLDPRVKILLTLLFMVIVFFVDTMVGYIPLFLYVAAIIYVAEIPVKSLIRGLKPILMIVVLTFIINLLTTPGQLLTKIWFLEITREGIEKSIFIAVRIVLLVMGTSLMTLTTSPIAMTDGLESLMTPLKVIRFPAHELAMMISIALRFIPTLFQEAEKIMKAQKARGADFESGNILNRAKAMIPLMVPLFINAFHRAEELATAMEARCYRGGKGRTRLNPLQMQTIDWISLAAVTVFFVVVAYLF